MGHNVHVNVGTKPIEAFPSGFKAVGESPLFSKLLDPFPIDSYMQICAALSHYTIQYLEIGMIVKWEGGGGDQEVWILLQATVNLIKQQPVWFQLNISFLSIWNYHHGNK